MDRFMVFIIGSIIGSFLNVCIYRMPKGKSVVSPGSHCPHCGKPVKWYHNVPVLSYLMLSGRCASCGKAISWRYPVVELMTATLILSAYVRFGPDVKFFVYSALLSALIVVAFIDLDTQEIPDLISLGGIAAGLAASCTFPWIFDTSSRISAVNSSIIGSIAGGGSIYCMGVVGKALFKREAMGGGDVKLMAMIGSFLGWQKALLIFFIAPVFGAAAGVVLKMRDGRDVIPYGPFLSLAAVIVIFFGARILGLMFYGMW
jgi:leader peptidase (prepilin peptidase)/N-methyltransferase